MGIVEGAANGPNPAKPLTPPPPSASLSGLRGDTVVYGLSIGIDRIAGLLLLPLLTAGLKRSEYALWTQVLAAHAVLSNVLLLGFYHSIARYVPGRPRPEVGRTLHGMLLLTLASSGAFVAAVALAPKSASALVFGTSEAIEVAVAGALFIGVGSLFEFLVFAFLRAEGRIHACSFYSIARSFLRLLVVWWTSSSGSNLKSMLLELALADGVLSVAAYAVHIVPKVEIALFGLGWEYWKSVLVYSLPIVATTILGWAIGNINRYIIVHQLGLSELAVYSANYSISSISSIVSLILPFVIVPHSNAARNQNNLPQVRRILEVGLTYYIYASLPLAVGVAVFYEPLAHLLLRGDYSGSAALVWSLAGFMFLVGIELITTFATLLEDSKYSILSRGAAVLTNVVLCVALMRSMNIAGAALAAFMAMVVAIALNLRRLRRYAGVRFPWGAVGHLALPVAGMGATGHALLRLLGTGIGTTLLAAVACLACFAAVELLQGGPLIKSLAGILQSDRLLPDSGASSGDSGPTEPEL